MTTSMRTSVRGVAVAALSLVLGAASLPAFGLGTETELVDEDTTDISSTTDGESDGSEATTDGIVDEVEATGDDTEALSEATGEVLEPVEDTGVVDGLLTELTGEAEELVEPSDSAEDPEGQTDPEDQSDDTTGTDDGATEDSGQPDDEPAPAEGADADRPTAGDAPASEDVPAAGDASGSRPPVVDEADPDGEPTAMSDGADRLLRVLLAEERTSPAPATSAPGGPDSVLPAPKIGPWTAPFVAPSYHRRGGVRSTAMILDLLGDPGPSTAARVLAPFPVAGYATYSDDWHAPRHGGRLHRGTDIFAARGTPVIASFDGVVSQLWYGARLGGNALVLTAPEGTEVYYAHLDGFDDGLAHGMSVQAGQVLGYVGDTGNALGTPPHLHYQIHPDGGEAVPPVPYLDAWLDDALAEARRLAPQTATSGLALPTGPQVVRGPVVASSPVVPPTAGVAGPPSTPIALATTPRRDSGVTTLLALPLLVAGGWYLLRRRRPVVVGAHRRAEIPDVLDPSLPTWSAPRSPAPAGAGGADANRDVLAPLLVGVASATKPADRDPSRDPSGLDQRGVTGRRGHE